MPSRPHLETLSPDKWNFAALHKEVRGPLKSLQFILQAPRRSVADAMAMNQVVAERLSYSETLLCQPHGGAVEGDGHDKDDVIINNKRGSKGSRQQKRPVTESEPFTAKKGKPIQSRFPSFNISHFPQGCVGSEDIQ